MNERWVRVEGHEMYEVSDLGRVRSYKVRRGRHADGKLPHILTPVFAGTRHAVKLDGEMQYVSSIVARAFMGETPEGCYICHIGDPLDNSLDNLVFKPSPASLRDHDSWCRRLSSEVVIAIRNDRAAGVKHRALADKYDVGLATVHRVCWGKVYGRVGGPITNGRLSW